MSDEGVTMVDYLKECAKMSKYVEFSTPWDYGALSFEHVECVSRIKVEDAIKYQKGIYNIKYGHAYDSDSDALYDFMTNHYANIVEYPDK